MASGYGLSRQIQGGFEGLDKGLARRDLGKQRERADTEFEQGQEDREYRLGRQEVTDTRADEQYNIQKKQQDRFMAGNDALRDYMTTGDLKSVNSFINGNSPEGMSHTISKTKDGGYEATIDFEGKSETKKITEDDIGTYMQMMMTSNPYEKLEERMSMKRAAETKGADRKHDIALIAKKHEGAVELEHIKGGYKVDAAEGKGAGSGKNLPWQKELNDLAKEDYGSVFGDQWKFDTTRDKAMRSAHADMSTAYYMQAGDENTNAAHRKASIKMRQFLGEASEQADQELDEGSIDKKQYDNRVADIIDALTDHEIKQQAPKPGEVLERGASGKTQGGAQDYPEPNPDHIRYLRENYKDADGNVDQQFLESFEKKFGPGTAEEFMQNMDTSGDFANSNNVAETDSGGDASLVRNAEASIQSKPKTDSKTTRLSRKESLKSGATSRKQHQQLAISEYKHEWVNMSDSEKLEWWAENSGALKAKSPRSHKKAAKDISKIHSTTGKGRNR